MPNRVVSLDLVAANPSVIACNMAQTPLESASVGCAVFCLSLMGVDYSAFLVEAQRALKMRYPPAATCSCGPTCPQPTWRGGWAVGGWS